MISLHPQVLEISGPDAAAFAHAQFCNDVLTLADGHWQWNAWLSPQGRLRAFFMLLRADAANLSLILRGGDVEWLCAELSRYVFRAKVTLRVASREGFGVDDAAEITAITGMLPEASAIVGQAEIVALTIPGNPLRWLLLGGDMASTGATAALERWRLADIRAGLPQIGVELHERLLPQWIGLDRLGAVSVRKGCYPGQEIMARLYFKGGNKRSLYRLRWAGNATPPPAIALRDRDGTEAGVILTVAHDTDAGCVEALATLSNAAADAPLKLESSSTCVVEIVQRFD